MTENIVEGFLWSDGSASDFGEGIESEAEVFDDEVGGELCGETVIDADEGIVGTHEGFVVAGVGDDDIGV